MKEEEREWDAYVSAHIYETGDFVKMKPASQYDTRPASGEE